MAVAEDKTHEQGEAKVMARLKQYSEEDQKDILELIKGAIQAQQPADKVSKKIKKKYGLKEKYTKNFYGYLQHKFSKNEPAPVPSPVEPKQPESTAYEAVCPEWYEALDEKRQLEIKELIGNATEQTSELQNQIMAETGVSQADAKALLEYIFGHPVLVHKWEKEFPLDWLDEHYAVEKYLGSGAFGCVGLARATSKHPFLPFKKKVAIKKMEGIFNHAILAKRLIRELRILRILKGHGAIVELLDVKIPKGDLKDFNKILLVFECVDSDLNAPFKKDVFYTENQVKAIFKQLLYGLKYCHSGKIVHRDLKPQNLLMNWNMSEDSIPDVKICDFGLARSFAARKKTTPRPTLSGNATSLLRPEQMNSKQLGRLAFKETMTAHVVTRYYRAPEVSCRMQNDRELSPAMDVWAMGCILGELLQMMKGNKASFQQRSVLIPGQYDNPSPLPEGMVGRVDPKRVRSQLQRTADLLGKPPAEFIEQIYDPQLRQELMLMPDVRGKDLSKEFPYGPAGALDLLCSLLVYDPRNRFTVEEALNHPWLADIPGLDETDLNRELDVSEMDFEDVPMSMYEIRCLVIDELAHWIPGLSTSPDIEGQKAGWAEPEHNATN